MSCAIHEISITQILNLILAKVQHFFCVFKRLIEENTVRTGKMFILVVKYNYKF